MKETFPVKKEGDKLGAGHVNALSSVARRVSAGYTGSHISGANGTLLSDPRPTIRRVQVTGLSVVNNEPTPQWPCETALYKVIPQFYDHLQRQWSVADEEGEFCMDGIGKQQTLALGDICAAYWDDQRDMFIQTTGVTDVTEVNVGGSVTTVNYNVTGSCCCDPTNCVSRYDEDGTELPVPSVYQISLPPIISGGFSCGCTKGDPSGLVFLRRTKTNADVYESDKYNCPDTRPSSAPCTVTATWMWRTSGCPGDCHYLLTYTVEGNPLSGHFWGYAGSDCGTVLDDPQGDCGCHTEQLHDPAEHAAGETASVPCFEFGGGGRWELQTTDAPEGCLCAPAPPDFDGTVNGQVVQTTCDSTTEYGPSETKQYESFWRYTTGITDYFGRVGCKLEFIVGGVVKLSYITNSVAGCCPYCVNKLEINQCGPFTYCSSTPGMICIQAARLMPIPACCTADKNGLVPTTFKLVAATEAPNPWVDLNGEDYQEESCCWKARGTIYLTWDDTYQAYVAEYTGYSPLYENLFPLQHNLPYGKCYSGAQFAGQDAWTLGRWQLDCNGGNPANGFGGNRWTLRLITNPYSADGFFGYLGEDFDKNGLLERSCFDKTGIAFMPLIHEHTGIPLEPVCNFPAMTVYPVL